MHIWALSSFPCKTDSCKHHFTLTSLSSCRSISLWWIPRGWIIIRSKGMSTSFLIAIAKLPSNNFIPIYTPNHTVRRSLFPPPPPLSNTKIGQFRAVWCELGVKRFSLWSFLPLWTANKDIKSLPLSLMSLLVSVSQYPDRHLAKMRSKNSNTWSLRLAGLEMIRSECISKCVSSIILNNLIMKEI